MSEHGIIDDPIRAPLSAAARAQIDEWYRLHGRAAAVYVSGWEQEPLAGALAAALGRQLDDAVRAMEAGVHELTFGPRADELRRFELESGRRPLTGEARAEHWRLRIAQTLVQQSRRGMHHGGAGQTLWDDPGLSGET